MSGRRRSRRASRRGPAPGRGRRAGSPRGGSSGRGWCRATPAVRPRSAVIRNDDPSSALPAVAPRVTRTWGRTRASSPSSHGPAGADVPGLRGLVDAPVPLAAEREVLDGVRDVGVLAGDARLDQGLVEQPAGGPDERGERAVLLVAGLLADEHHPRGRRARPEDGAGRALVELAGGAAGGPLAQCVQVGGRSARPTDGVGDRGGGVERSGTGERSSGSVTGRGCPGARRPADWARRAAGPTMWVTRCRPVPSGRAGLPGRPWSPLGAGPRAEWACRAARPTVRVHSVPARGARVGVPRCRAEPADRGAAEFCRQGDLRGYAAAHRVRCSLPEVRVVDDGVCAVTRSTDLRRHARLLHQAHDARLSGSRSQTPLRRVVSRSWDRVLSYGVAPDGRSLDDPAAPDVVERRRAESPIAKVLPELRASLTAVAEDAEHIMVVTAADGFVLWREGAVRVGRLADALGFLPGADWTEAAVGHERHRHRARRARVGAALLRRALRPRPAPVDVHREPDPRPAHRRDARRRRPLRPRAHGAPDHRRPGPHRRPARRVRPLDPARGTARRPARRRRPAAGPRARARPSSSTTTAGSPPPPASRRATGWPSRSAGEALLVHGLGRLPARAGARRLDAASEHGAGEGATRLRLDPDGDPPGAVVEGREQWRHALSRRHQQILALLMRAGTPRASTPPRSAARSTTTPTTSSRSAPSSPGSGGCSAG